MRTPCFLFLFTLLACQAPPEGVTPQGCWKSVGYGKYLQIEGDTYAFYDAAARSCLPAEAGELSAILPGMESGQDTLTLRKGTSRYAYVRVDSLPPYCSRVPGDSLMDDPVYNFEVFAATLEEHFAYFGRNAVPWDSLYRAFRGRVRPEMSRAALYLLLDSLLVNLRDNHGSLEPDEATWEEARALLTAAGEAGPGLPELGDFQVADRAAAAFLDKDLTRDSRLMKWGLTPEGGGYIQLKALWLFAEGDLDTAALREVGFVEAYARRFGNLPEPAYIKAEAEGASHQIDRVMADLEEAPYIILDIRFNGGGQDAVSAEVLRRFNSRRRFLGTKQAVARPGYTPSDSLYLEAGERPYTRPVYLLTSRQTASAADFLAYASLQLPNVTRIGSPTQGAMSDALEKQLPNGWYFSLSNEIYLDPAGACYETMGIPPDLYLDYPQDRQAFFYQVYKDAGADRDRVMEVIRPFHAAQAPEK